MSGDTHSSFLVAPQHSWPLGLLQSVDPGHLCPCDLATRSREITFVRWGYQATVPSSQPDVQLIPSVKHESSPVLSHSECLL